MQEIDHLLHRNGNGIVLDERVIFEQRLKDWLGDDMLGQHFNRFLAGHGRIQILMQTFDEFIKRLFVRPFFKDKPFDTRNMLFGDCRNILRPKFPIAAGADLLHHAGVDDALQLGELHREFKLNGATLLFALRSLNDSPGVSINIFASAALRSQARNRIDDDSIRLALVEVDLVDLRIESVIMRTESVENRPHHRKGVTLIKRLLRAHILGDDYGDDDITILFPSGPTHHTPDGLNDIDL